MARYAIVTDLNRCVGCQACSAACKTINGVMPGDFWIKTLRIGPTPKEGGSGDWPDVEMYFLPIQCQHCEDPECVKVCPTQASHVTEDGTVQIDKDKCIGCQFCAMACPYGVRYLNEEERVVEKCTLCEQITAQGGLPQCVIQCGGRARFFGDLDKGIDSFEAPEIGYDVDRSYDNLYTGNRVKLGDMAKEYTEADVHHLPDVGNGPHFAYILRDRDWTGGESWNCNGPVSCSPRSWPGRPACSRPSASGRCAERAAAPRCRRSSPRPRFWSWAASRCSSIWSTGSASSTASDT